MKDFYREWQLFTQVAKSQAKYTAGQGQTDPDEFAVTISKRFPLDAQQRLRVGHAAITASRKEESKINLGLDPYHRKTTAQRKLLLDAEYTKRANIARTALGRPLLRGGR